jgi:RimJ/RimL family protein N-acetyltransferase
MQVETARLLLRPFEPADIPAYAAIRAKPEVMRFLPGGAARALTAEADAARLVPELANQWRTVGYGPWAVVDRAGGALLGHAGLRRVPQFGDETEILYMLDSPAWGRGLATEAAIAARDAAFGTFGLAGLVAFALPENQASLRVLAKVGMREAGTVEIFGITGRLLRLARDP